MRVEVNDIGQQGLIDLKRKIQKEYKTLSVDLKQRDKKIGEDDSDIVEEARAILEDRNEMMKIYCKDRGIPDGMDEDHLMAIGNKCIEGI